MKKIIRGRKKRGRIRLFIIIILLFIFSKRADNLFNGFLQSEVEINQDYESQPHSETFNTLESMTKQDKRIDKILANYNEYPEELLEMLSRNTEMLDFVLDYPEKKGEVYAKKVKKAKKGSIPLLLQWDKKWGYGNYGDSIIAISGCGPTTLSMIVTGLTGDNSVTPYKVAQFAEEKGYYVSGTGTSWSLFTEGSQYFGLQANEIPLSESSIYGALQSGQPIICSMRPGDFTTTGHFIILTGIEDGKIKVNDPNSNEKSNKLWDYQTLQYQINNLWSFTTL